MARAKRKKSGATFGSRTDVGCVREHNEDSLAVAPPLYMVCDGMGGHAAGEVASEIAVDVICDRAPAHPDASALGQAVEEAVKEIGAVVEGYYAAANARTLAQKVGVEMPIAQAAYEVLYEGRDVHSVVTDLMSRAKRSELDESWS